MKKELQKSVFMEVFGANPEARVLDYLLTIHPLECSVSDIAENACVSRTTLHYRIMPFLTKNGVIMHRRMGKMKVFRLNGQNSIARKLMDVDRELVLSELKKRMAKEAAVTA